MRVTYAVLLRINIKSFLILNTSVLEMFNRIVFAPTKKKELQGSLFGLLYKNIRYDIEVLGPNAQQRCKIICIIKYLYIQGFLKNE